jgi:hypothetical protein
MNDKTNNEIASRLPKSFRILAAWAKERGLIRNVKEDEKDAGGATNTARDKS